MSLENVQSSNFSSDVLRAGADVALAAEKLGLSPEEALKAVSRKTRRQEMRRSRAEREASWAQKAKSLANQGFEVNLPDNDLFDPALVDPFGESERFQNFGQMTAIYAR